MIVLLLIFIIAFPLILPSNAFAEMWEIYTYGSGEFVAKTFESIKMLFSSGELKGLIKLVVLLGFLVFLARAVFSIIDKYTGSGVDNSSAGIIALIRASLLAVVAVVLFSVPKTNVMIIDRIDPSQTQTVTNVPFVNAVVASWTSIIGDKIGSMIEETLTPVDAPKIRGDGFIVGPKYTNEILDIMPPGSPAEYGDTFNKIPIRMIISQWFERCIIPNFVYIPGENSEEAQGLYELRYHGYLLQAWNSSIFRNPIYTLTIENVPGQPITCADAPTVIANKWMPIFNKWIEKEITYSTGEKVGLVSPVDTLRKIYMRYIQPHTSWSFDQSMVQIALINMFRSSMLAYDAKYGSGNLKDQLAESQTGSGWIQAGRLLSKLVFITRQLFEALVFGLSIFLPVAFVIGGINALVQYIKITFWLQLWVPGFVLVNAFADWQFYNVMEQMFKTLQSSPSDGISFENLEKIRTHSNLIIGYIGAFMWSVPTLAWGLLKGSEYAMITAIGAISTEGRGTAQSVGAQVGGAANVTLGSQTMGGTSFMSNTTIGSAVSGAHGATVGVNTLLGGMQPWKKYGSEAFQNAIANLESFRIGSGSLPGGIERYFTMGQQSQDISFANTRGVYTGVGGNMDLLASAAAIETKWRTLYGAMEKEGIVKAMTPEEWQKRQVASVLHDWGGIQGLVSMGRAIGFTGDDHEVVQQMGNFARRGGVLDDRMASAINRSLFGGRNVVTAGMRADVGVTPDGRISYFTAIAQDGIKGIDLRDGKLTERGMLTNANVAGHAFTGNYMSETDLKTGATIGAYTGIVDGKEGSITVGPDGKAVRVRGESGESFTGTMPASEALKIIEANKDSFITKDEKAAYDKMHAELSRKASQGEAVDYKITSADGKTASIQFGSKMTGEWSTFNTDTKGWRKTREALDVIDKGLRERIGNDSTIGDKSWTQLPDGSNLRKDGNTAYREGWKKEGTFKGKKAILAGNWVSYGNGRTIFDGNISMDGKLYNAQLTYQDGQLSSWALTSGGDIRERDVQSKETGKTETEHKNARIVHTGTTVRGSAINDFAGEMAKKLGADDDTAMAIREVMGYGQNVAQEISSYLGLASKALPKGTQARPQKPPEHSGYTGKMPKDTKPVEGARGPHSQVDYSDY